MSQPDPKDAAFKAIHVALGVAAGDTKPSDGAKELMEIIISMVPVDELKDFLTARDKAWADAAADVAEEIKLDT